jgi:superfamily II DNA or RNA helicase
MADIEVVKINEVYNKIICEDSIQQELSEYFTFKIPDHHFNPLVKAKRWDGLIKLFNKRNNHIYGGLLKYICIFAEDRGYTLDCDPDCLLLNNISLIEGEEYLKSLNIRSQGKPLTIRDYQIMAFSKAIRYKRLLLRSPTASGKSLIIYGILRYLLQQNSCKGLLIVPTTNLVEQMYGDFVDYSTANGWDADKHIQRIYDGYSKELDPSRSIVISTWQSIWNNDPSFFEGFDFIIGDEAHQYKAKCLSTIMKKCINASYRIGTTGSLDGIKINKLVIEGHFGPLVRVTTTRKLMDEGHIANLSIKALVLKHPKGVYNSISVPGDPKKTYHNEIGYLIGCPARNRFIRNLALSVKGNTLILFKYVNKHGQILYDLLTAKDPNRKVYYIHGGTETEDREKIRAIVENEENSVIVASSGVFSTGINIRNLHNLIFAAPTKSQILVTQSIGRSLRLGDNKTEAVLYDIADDLRDTKQDEPNFTLKHHADRLVIYYAENFNISNYNIELK